MLLCEKIVIISNMKQVKGFSIVELIVAIVIIAILFTIAIVSYAWMRKDAEVSAYIATIKQIEKGLHLKFTREGKGTWPLDTDMVFPRGASLSVSNADMLAASKKHDFSKYIGNIPPTVGVGPDLQIQRIVYVNQGWNDDIPSCDLDYGDTFEGVFLVMFVRSPDILNDIDKQIDDGDINCGRIRKGVGSAGGRKYTLKYILSQNQAL